ncbi:hypothetical protein BC830DRAFT_1171283 [Chytriomyces sp. MP71]|nr:hypothetical protein BC830DRAFT_1171283 [Chytriomyces sp. MP71]
MDLILASQSPFSSNAEFESVDMYGYKFSLSVAQPPGTKRSDTVATFTYHSTDYQFSRTQLHSTLLNPLAYSSPNTSTLLHFGNGEGSIQMDLTSRRKGRLFAKEKFSSFATAEASRGAFFHQYAMEMRDQENKFLQLHQRSSPAPQYSSSFDNVYNNTSSVSLGRNQPARSSSISPDGSLRAQDSKGEWQLRFSQNGAQSFTGRSFSTVQSYPHQGASPNHSSMNMVNGGISSSSLDRASSASSTMPRFPGRASTLSHESYPPLNGWAGDRFEDTSSFARRSFSQRSTLPRGPNIPMPIKAPSGSFKNSQLAATLSQMTDNDKYPVFGVIHLSDESICVSEAEGLKDLMLLVGTVYAVWSRSVLKPLEKLEYHHLNRTNSTSF